MTMRDSSERQRQTVLVLDDDGGYLDLCRRELPPRNLITTTTPDEARAVLAKQPVDVLLVDLFIGDPDPGAKKRALTAWGINVIAAARATHPDLEIILVSDGHTLTFAKLAVEHGADAAVPKSHFSPLKIIRLLETNRLIELYDSCTPRTIETLARHEREYIAQVYLANNRNMSRTAKQLDISRATLYSKLRTWRE
jgi:ActR/RegA family two-component response regulator